jgi:hypothetical protein
LFFTLIKIPNAVDDIPIGIKITAPFAHFESIELALNITAETMQTKPNIPVVNIVNNFGNLGNLLIIIYRK